MHTLQALRDIGAVRRMELIIRKVWAVRWARIAILSLPILIYYLPLLLSGNKISAGDPDYYMSLYEGFRRSVLEFHQFPWWDPWIAGGVPLFGNVQFGLVSVPTPFVLLFGTAFGIKLGMFVYGIIGFFGARRLFYRYFGTSPARAIALAYVFVFCGFFAARVRMGHITFPLAVLTPWILYYYFYIQEKGSWWKFALWLSLLILSSPHYIAIMTVYMVGIIFAVDVIRKFWVLKQRQRNLKSLWAKNKQWFMKLLKAAALIILLTAYRMYYVIDFFRDHQRKLSVSNEHYTGLKNIFQAIWWHADFVHTPNQGLLWGWGEIATYIGFTTFIAICLIFVSWLFYRKKFLSQFSHSLVGMVIVAFTFMMMGMGDFARWAPYALAQKLPLFSAMRVSTRWIFWVACMSLVIIAAYKGRKYARTITVLCFIAAIELLIRYPATMPQPYFIHTTQYRAASAPFYEERYNHVPRPQYINDRQFQKDYWFDQNLLESTDNNVGQVFASDSLLYEAALGQTIRCGIGAGNRMPCPFVESNNAKVTYWSPAKVIVERTGPGAIELDMNPGRGWRVNDLYPFTKGKSVSPTDRFLFGGDNKKTYTITYAPKFSPSWFIWKIKRIF
ncbi:MAG TPA: hypothetical protein VLG16_01290 [Candidatus Saccharimonadales bacterium]|nr:hypothetical protein [Candidatus Saccharimonadales bacterium]